MSQALSAQSVRIAYNLRLFATRVEFLAELPRNDGLHHILGKGGSRPRDRRDDEGLQRQRSVVGQPVVASGVEELVDLLHRVEGDPP